MRFSVLILPDSFQANGMTMVQTLVYMKRIIHISTLCMVLLGPRDNSRTQDRDIFDLRVIDRRIDPLCQGAQDNR